MRGVGWIAPALAAAGLVGFGVAFARERAAFRAAVVSWAERDLNVRAQLAASTLAEPLATSDFRRIHGFGAECDADGVRLTVFGPGGGVHFDTLRRGDSEPDSMYATSPCGEYAVRLGIPLARVLAPFDRSAPALALACLAGIAGVLLVVFTIYRQSVRIRELARLEKFRREFTADVSHELKTPLTGLMLAADMIGEETDAERRTQLAAMVKSEASRLNDLAQDILDLARLERENDALDLSDADVVAVARDAVGRLSALASERGVAVSFASDCGGEGGAVARCDARLVGEAVSNLAENAIRHSGAKEVAVSVSATRRDVRVAVEDHGCGIPPEHAKRVFERFHRVDPSRAAKTGGAGLGLAIVKRIAELHGGSAALKPATPTGCVFTLTLPRR